MYMPLFWIYVVVELAVVVVLAKTIGVGWTLLVLIAAFVLGVAMAGSQIKRQVQRLRGGLTTTPQGAVTDSALVALGTLLVFIPGLVTSVLGLLLLLPPTRAIARPAVTFLALRRLERGAPLITVATVGAQQYQARRRPDYVDGEVIDVSVPYEWVDDPPASGPPSAAYPPASAPPSPGNPPALPRGSE